MLWLLSCFLFASTLAYPLGSLSGMARPEFLNVQLERFSTPLHRRICLPSPFFGQLCLPSAFDFIMPLRSSNLEGKRCLFIPLMAAHVIKVCPGEKGETLSKENSNGTRKEIMKEVGEEKEEKFLPDNANIEVGGEEVEPENFVKKEKGVESKESQVEDKDIESKNKIIQVSEEIIEVSNGNVPPKQPQTEFSDKNLDENVSITSNLV